MNAQLEKLFHILQYEYHTKWVRDYIGATAISIPPSTLSHFREQLWIAAQRCGLMTVHNARSFIKILEENGFVLESPSTGNDNEWNSYIRLGS